MNVFEEAKVDYGSYRCHWRKWTCGNHLLPALVARGHEVVNVSRGTASPYREHAAWKAIEQVAVERKAEEAEGRFGVRIADLNADIVVDMISFELEGAQQSVEALRGKVEHYLFCSSIWVYGHATTVPSVGTTSRTP